jgi:hypothetical protein
MNNEQEYVIVISKIIYLYYKNIKKFKNKYKTIKTDYSILFNNFLIYFQKSINEILKLHNILQISYDESLIVLNLMVNNHNKIKKIIGKTNKIYNNCQKKMTINMDGGFFYNKFDSVFTKILNVIDILIDFISIVPKHILFDNDIIAPFQIFSGLSNLMRGNFILAFYSFITLIPGIGNTVGAGSKIIYRLINHIYDRIHAKKQIIELNNVENMKNIYKLSDFDPLSNYINENLNDLENDDLLIGNK